MSDNAAPIREIAAIEPKPSLADHLNSALPWLAVVLSFIGISHACKIETLATDAAGGNAQAFAAAQRLWLTPLAACCAGLITAYFTSMKLRAIAAVAASILMPLLAFISPAALFPLLLVPIGVIVAEFYFNLKHSRRVRMDLVAAALLTFIITYAAHKRQLMFFQIVNQAPDPDLDSYLKIAGKSAGWATFFREPLYIWVFQLVDVLGGDLDVIMARLTGILTGLGAIVSVFYLCYRHLNLGVAVIAASLYAGQKFMIYTSVRGLREDTIIMTTMLFISVSWSHFKHPATWRSLTVWGLLGAACSLLRISSLSYCLLVIAGTAIFRSVRDVKQWPLRARYLLPMVLTFGLFAPYLVHCKQEYNNPMFVVTNAMRYYANQELGGKHPDFPTAAEIAKDPTTGGPMTAGKYIFGYHSLSEVIGRTWDGFTKTFFGAIFKISYNLQESPGMQGILYVLHLIGIALLLLPRNIYLVLAILLFHTPLFFLGSFNYFDPRLLIVAMPFSYITVAAAIGLAGAYGWRYLRPQTASEPAYGSAAKSRKGKAVRSNRKRKSSVS